MQAPGASKSDAVPQDEHSYAQTDQEETKQKDNLYGRDETSEPTAGENGNDVIRDTLCVPADTKINIHATKTARPNTLNSASDNLPTEKSPPEPKICVINYPGNVDAIFPLSAAEEVVEDIVEEAVEVKMLYLNPLSSTQNRTGGQSISGSSINCDNILLPGGKSDRVEVIHNCAEHGPNHVVVICRKIPSDSSNTRSRSPENNGKTKCTKFLALSNDKTKLEGRTDEAQPGPSKPKLVSLISEDECSTESSDSEFEGKMRRMRRQTLPVEKDTTQALSDKENTVIDLTKTFNRKSSKTDWGSISQQWRPLERNFHLWEQKLMIKYLIDTDSIYLAKGNKIWKQMIADGVLKHRTYQSLHNHFRKVILKNLDRFAMAPEIRAKFEKLKR